MTVFKSNELLKFSFLICLFFILIPKPFKQKQKLQNSNNSSSFVSEARRLTLRVILLKQVFVTERVEKKCFETETLKLLAAGSFSSAVIHIVSHYKKTRFRRDASAQRSSPSANCNPTEPQTSMMSRLVTLHDVPVAAGCGLQPKIDMNSHPEEKKIKTSM